MSPSSTRSPFTPSSTMSGIPPARVPITARPRANDSIATLGSPSEADGSRSARASSTRRRELRRLEAPLPLDPVPREAFGDLGQRPRPDQVQLRPGHAAAASRQAAASPSTFL